MDTLMLEMSVEEGKGDFKLCSVRGRQQTFKSIRRRGKQMPNIPECY